MILRRGVQLATLNRLSQESHPILFAWLDWPGDPVRVHSGVGDIAWDGHTWRGVGLLGNIDIPTEASEIAAVEAVLSLAGVAADLDGYADDAIRNRSVALYLGVTEGRPGGHDGAQTTGEGSTLVGDPVQLFAGTMDGLTLTASVTDNGVQHAAEVSVATGQEARSMATVYHSDEDQRSKYPGDTAGRLVILAYAKAQKTMWPEN